MAALITTWEQSAIYDPTNPNQRVYSRYAGIPGTYASYYYNQVPNTAKLMGVLDTMPSWLGALLVGSVAVAAGFFGARFVPASVRRKLPGLSGARRRRR